MIKNKLQPELRFPEFSGDWDYVKLSNACLINPKTNNLPNKFYYIDLESVSSGVLKKNRID